jgi:hypothetical protein
MLSGRSLASPVYYTFQGTVSSVTGSDRSIFDPDDAVQYVFLVDRDLPGILLHHTITYPLTGDPVAATRFYYAEFISGTVEGVSNIEYGDKSYFGMEQASNGSVATTLRGSEDLVDGIAYPDLRRNTVSIYAGSPIESWFVGQTGFRGENLFPAPDGSHALISSALTLAEVSDAAVPAVPEPSSFASLLAGLVLFLTCAMIKKERKPRIFQGA